MTGEAYHCVICGHAVFRKDPTRRYLFSYFKIAIPPLCTMCEYHPLDRLGRASVDERHMRILRSLAWQLEREAKERLAGRIPPRMHFNRWKFYPGEFRNAP